MATRRTVLLGALATHQILADAAQPKTAVNFKVPAHACDCHTHIFGDPATFPYFAGRGYTPESALPKQMNALHKALGIERVVIVQPSVYGTDNSATLYGMKLRGKTARGIAVIDDQTSERELDAMHRAGMRGIRLNLSNGPQTTTPPRERFTKAAERMTARKWHIQMNVAPSVITNIKDLVMASPVPVVFDHFGGADFSAGLPQITDLLDLVKSGKAYVKISISQGNVGQPYTSAAPLAKALIAANVDRILWGTDWPHPNAASGRKPTEVSPLKQVDDGEVLNQLALWAPDPATRQKILVDNPAKLYEF